MPSQKQRHILTVSLEDYFQVLTFRKLIPREQWMRFDTRMEANTLRVLDLLDKYEVKATFFVLGWVAERRPDLIREVTRRGHEVANKGYYPASFRDCTPHELRENLFRAREVLESATGTRVVGCRIPQARFSHQDLWALDLLAGENYSYDSSMVPSFWSFSSEPWRRFVHEHKFKDKALWEFPISTYRVLGCNLPISGGNYIRQFPARLVERLADHWSQRHPFPLVMYFHIWELDPEQVRIEGTTRLERIRQYRNLDRMASIWEGYLSRYRFTGIADYLGIDIRSGFNHHSNPAAKCGGRKIAPADDSVTSRERVSISLVVPCYNEEAILPYLANTLRDVFDSMKGEYEVHFVFVDDGSTDQTHSQLTRLFDGWPRTKIIRHERNAGVASAIITGIRGATTEIVCSMDCDCTYDPHLLAEMIPRLGPGIDVVTASPYHPQGHVRNVPAWRLALSRISSFLYRCVLRQKLHTYTSCFRVYRKSAVQELTLRNGHFIGVAEILGELDLRNSRFEEYPATLEVRLIGHSKMNLLKSIFGHLRLLARLAVRRLRREQGFRTGVAATINLVCTMCQIQP
jgi:polysaccharide deacetylase family protein (PEP-CTERM system associated)